MGCDPEFHDQLRQVLSHLYDLAYLQNHPFLEWFGGVAQPGVSRNQALRRLVLEAMEQLDPGTHASPRSPEARSYQILAQRFLEGRSPAEVSSELGIVERQFYRDQRTAIDALASILWERRPSEATLPSEGGAAHGAVLSEVERMRNTSARERVDLCELLADAFGLARRLVADDGASRFGLDCPAEPLVVSTNRMLVRQAVLQVFEGLSSFGGVRSAVLRPQLTETNAHIVFEIVTDDASSFATHILPHLDVARQVLQPVEGAVSLAVTDGQTLRLTATIPLGRAVVLVIEDNRDAIQLVQRYLADRDCRVLGASSGAEGLSLAQQLKPTVILLDLMMPGEDGWETLQKLKADITTSVIPTIVCSVLPQESLARALGAEGYLRKPFTREGLLMVLDPLLGA